MLVGVWGTGGRPARAGASSKGRGGVGEGERDLGRAAVVRLAGSWLSKMQVRDKTSVLGAHTRSRARQAAVCYGCSETSNSARWTPSGDGGLRENVFYMLLTPTLSMYTTANTHLGMLGRRICRNTTVAALSDQETRVEGGRDGGRAGSEQPWGHC
ncbi:hypothetical protein E2C01_094009 [Portunus trituberculatus]|uniref:Uncharacterized protein n=1 Tax=Portunus trituberculatus TaxID=210409 RepID=A0A5B7JW31_PORTR|nr:hypothetical protein [Portunus trituberculatus]